MPDAARKSSTYWWKVTVHLIDGLSITIPSGGSVFGPPLIAEVVDGGVGKWMIVAKGLAMDGTPLDVVSSLTRQKLSPLIEAIRFRSRMPEVVKEVVTERIAPGGGEAARSIPIQASAVIAQPFTLPTETKILGNARVHAWMKLWNDAKSSSSDLDSIRTCFVICEDMDFDDISSKSAQAFEDLRVARHFAGHGGELGDPIVVAALASKIAAGTRRFDPTDQRHLQFMRNERAAAEIYVADLIESQLR